MVGQSSIGGISQPIIGQKKIEHEIRLKDGESSLIGGILDDSQTRSLAGIPGLAQIPILGYLFGQRTQDHSQDETVFAITPHIIRGTTLNELNQRAIDIGTANAIELRHMSRPQTVPASQTPANPAPAGGGAPANPNPGSPVPAQTPIQGAAPGTQGSANFLFDPGQITATKGGTFVVNLLISGAQNVYSVPVQMNYDPAKLQLVNVSNGGFLSQDGQAVALVHREDDTTGTLQITATRPPGARRSFRARRGGHDDISGKSQRTDSADHYSGRRARSCIAGDHGEWRASLSYGAVGDACPIEEQKLRK